MITIKKLEYTFANVLIECENTIIRITETRYYIKTLGISNTYFVELLYSSLHDYLKLLSIDLKKVKLEGKNFTYYYYYYYYHIKVLLFLMKNSKLL